jgi:hypothetical protein
MLNPRSVTTVSHKYSLTVARHATMGMAVTSTVHCSDNYNMKIFQIFQIKFKTVNKLFTPIVHYKLLRVKVPSYDTQTYYNSAFCKKKNLQRG